MAQTGYTPILIYSSSTAAQAPAAGNLTNSTLGSELAINITDGKLFYKDNANAVQVIAWKTTPTTAGGTGLTSYTAGDLLYYASGTTLTKLGIGTAYQALQVNAGGTAPSWQPSATSVLTAQGDLLYASAANTLARLAKSTTATRYLANTGTNNNPAWAQIDLTNGVTGTLPVGSGGTGATTFTAGRILFGNATSAINTSANLFWDNANSRLGIGTTGPITQLSNTATAWAGGTASDGFAWRSTQNDWTATILGTPASGAGYGLRLHTLGTTTSDYPLFISSGASAGTAKFTVQGDGTITFTGGNIIQGTAAKGVNFTANTPAAGMTSQLLNWYEEGTFTAGLTCGSGSVTLKSTNNTCAYTRIGRQVTITGYLEINTASTPSGTLLLTGLPFTIKNANSAYPTGIPYFSVTGAITGTPVMLGYTNTTTVSFRRMSGGTALDDLAGVLGADSQIIFTFVYIV